MKLQKSFRDVLLVTHFLVHELKQLVVVHLQDVLRRLIVIPVHQQATNLREAFEAEHLQLVLVVGELIEVILDDVLDAVLLHLLVECRLERLVVRLVGGSFGPLDGLLERHNRVEIRDLLIKLLTEASLVDRVEFVDVHDAESNERQRRLLRMARQPSLRLRNHLVDVLLVKLLNLRLRVANVQSQLLHEVLDVDGAEDERADSFELQRHHVEILLADLQDPDFLLDRLALRQRRRHRRSRLGDESFGSPVHLRLDAAVVLVSPDDEIEEARQFVLGDEIEASAVRSILVQDHHVEDVLVVDVRLEDFDFVVAEEPGEAFVVDVTQAVQREFRRVLLQNDRRDFHLAQVVPLAEVVDESRLAEDVHGTQVTGAANVVVVAVDGEQRNGNIIVRIFEVGGAFRRKVYFLIAEELKVDLLVAQQVRAQQVDASGMKS